MVKVLRKSILLVFVWLAIQLILPSTSDAQRITGNLQGRLLDSLDHQISGANVIVTGVNLQGNRGAVSDTAGYFVHLALPPGVVEVQVNHTGYQRVTFENVVIQIGKTTSLGEIRLRQHVHELPDVIVSGERPFIDPTTASHGKNIRSSQFDVLPMERNYRGISSMFPQANLSYYGDEINIAGATGRENKYYVDGVDITDAHFGKTETNLPYNFVKEIQITTGGYEAEYRSSLGGLINVVTHSGSNVAHGSLFGFYTSDWLAAQPKTGLLDPTQGAFSNYDFGGSIGFPIIRDELWFYGAYNPSFNLRDVDVPGLTMYKDKTVAHPLAAKLSWKASEELNLALSLTAAPNERTAIGGDESHGVPVALENADPYLMRDKETGMNLTLNGSYIVNETLLMEASLSRITRDEIHEPFTERGRKEIVFIDEQKAVWSGGSFGPWSFLRDYTEIKLAGTFLFASHGVKAGIEFRDNAATVDVLRQWYQYPSPYNDTLYFQLINRVLGTVHNRMPSFFLQDTWQITEGLRLHAGIRWDGQYLTSTDGKVAQRITDQYQPRFGFVFLPSNDGAEKFFGSFGRFAQEIHTIVSAGYHSDQSYHYEINYDRDPRGGNANADTVVNQPAKIEPEIAGLNGQFYDEFSLGYERMLGTNSKISLLGVYRTLREAIDDSWIPSETRFLIGNPGKGKLSHISSPQRDYTAIIISVDHHGSSPLDFSASYVLSRNYGNYPGLFDSYFTLFGPNTTTALDFSDPLNRDRGLLPNDRTHVFKFWASYRFDHGITAGTSFTLQSGTPLSEWAGFGTFVAPRGTSGRTPSIWDLNARISYEFPVALSHEARLILDLFHIASQRKPVNIVQKRYSSVDQNGNGVGPNPNYGKAYRYQPPMSMRLGLEVSF